MQHMKGISFADVYVFEGNTAANLHVYLLR